MEIKRKAGLRKGGSANDSFKRIKVLVSGLPGDMATNIAKKIAQQDDMELEMYALTGEGIVEKIGYTFMLEEEMPVVLANPQNHRKVLELCRQSEVGIAQTDLVVDFTAPPIKGQPSQAGRNAELFCSLRIPFIMGTTGADVEAITRMVVDSGNVAVLAPNMATPIIIFQDMIEFAARKYPGALKGYHVALKESHQAGKKDTSGTMKAVAKAISRLGIPAEEKDIEMERDPEAQLKLGVPKENLSGHAYHWYTLKSPDGSVKLGFSHLVNGRDVYAFGALDAIRFLNRKIEEGVKGKLYSMFDVLGNSEI